MFLPFFGQKGNDMKYGRGVGVAAPFESLENRRLMAAGDPDVTFGTGGKMALGTSVDDWLGTRGVLIPYSANQVIVVGNVLQRRNLSDGSLATDFGGAG